MTRRTPMRSAGVGIATVAALVAGCGAGQEGGQRATSGSASSPTAARSAQVTTSTETPVNASRPAGTSQTPADSTVPTNSGSGNPPSADAGPTTAAPTSAVPTTGDPGSDRSPPALQMVARIRAHFPNAVTAIDDTHLALLTTRSYNGEYLSGWMLQEVELPSGRVTRSVEGPDDSPVGVAVTPSSVYVTVSLTAKPSAARNRLIRIRRSDFSVACRTTDAESMRMDPAFIVSVASIVWTTQYDGSLLRFADGGCAGALVPVVMPTRASGPYGLASNGHQLFMTTSWPTSDTLPAAESPWEGEVDILDGIDRHQESTVHLTAAHLYAGTLAVVADGNDVLAADESLHQIHVISGGDVTTVVGPPRVAALADGVSLAADPDGCVVFHGSIPIACPDFLDGEAVIGSGGNLAILAPDTVGDNPELLVVRVTRK